MSAAAFRTEQMEVVNRGGNHLVTDEMTRRDPYGQHRPISNVIYTRAKQRVIPGKLPKLAEATVICTCNGPHVNLVVLPVPVVTE